MDSILAQLNRQARIRYLPLRPFSKQGVQHVLDNACSITARGDSFGDAIDYFLLCNRELGERLLGCDLFRMILSCEDFPLRVESYAELRNRRERAVVLREKEYRVMGQSFQEHHVNFAHKIISPMTPAHRLVMHMELQRSEWTDLRTSNTAIAIVPTAGPLNIAHSDGSDLLPSGNAAIIMTGARLLVQGKGFFVFHPIGMPVK